MIYLSIFWTFILTQSNILLILAPGMLNHVWPSWGLWIIYASKQMRELWDESGRKCQACVKWLKVAEAEASDGEGGHTEHWTLSTPVSIRTCPSQTRPGRSCLWTATVSLVSHSNKTASWCPLIGLLNFVTVNKNLINHQQWLTLDFLLAGVRHCD